MIPKFKKYGKFKELFANTFECKISFISLAIIEFFLYFFGVYENFCAYNEMLNSLLVTIIGALIGVLALILSGIAFFGALFDNEYVNDLVKYTEDENVIDKLFCSFQFLAFNIVLLFIATMVVLLSINSSRKIANVWLFYFFSGMYIYWLTFVIAYAVALIKNCVELIMLKYDNKNMKYKKTFFDRANEIRIDLLITTIMNNDKELTNEKEKEKEILEKLNESINLTTLNELEKKQLMDYYIEYYKSGE